MGSPKVVNFLATSFLVDGEWALCTYVRGYRVSNEVGQKVYVFIVVYL